MDTLNLFPEVPPMVKTRLPYLPEFRRQMVELVRAGRDPEDLAPEFESTAQSIRKLDRASRQERGPTGGCATLPERCQLDELSPPRRENKQLRVERDIRAKVAACFARDTVTLPSGSWGP